MRSFYRTLRMAIHALRRNVMRSSLTTLGIVIGVGAVIMVVEMIQGSAKTVNDTIARMGADILMVQPGAASSGGVTFGFGSNVTLTPQDADAIARECPAVHSVAPVVRIRHQVVYGNRNWTPMYIYGTTPSYLEVRNWEDLEEGSSFTDRDVRNSSKICLLGQTVVRNLFGEESPLGKEIRVNNVPLRVVGVLSSKGANMMGLDEDDILLAPWTTIKARVSGDSAATATMLATAKPDPAQPKVNSLKDLYPTGSKSLYPERSASQLANNPQPVRFVNVDRIMVRVEAPELIPEASRQITELLHERHRIGPGQPDDFNIRDMTETTRTLAKAQAETGAILLVVSLISLIVGGVGIMNIMLVAVTERTREIGLRMAVGARASDILRQFLLESVVLCLLGGAVGIVMGRSASFLIFRCIYNWATEPSLVAIIAAVGVSATVGIVFGYYPAWRASRLDPIQALRYE